MLHQRNIFFIMMHMIAACACILMFKHSAVRRKHIPDARASAVRRIRSLYLIGAARNTPHKILSKHSYNLLLLQSQCLSLSSNIFSDFAILLHAHSAK